MISKVFSEDLQYILKSSCVEWDKFKNSSILISGATGLICSTVAKALIYAEQQLNLNMQIYCLVRNIEKAKQLFSDFSDCDCLHFIEGDVVSPIECDAKFRYIIHGASPTASKYFIEHPVGTINTAVNGTDNLLDRGVKDKAEGFVYLSSMEAYGNVTDERTLTEDILGNIDLSNIRSSYPESKRLCELLVNSYANEFGIRAASIRLAQTFGPGVSKDDARVFAMMARCVQREEPIILLTKGTSRHPYLYTAQAVTAILCVLLKGTGGEIYNAANPDTYCSIYEMGLMVAEQLAGGKISVEIAESEESRKYPASGYLNLNIDKIKAIGWTPEGTLKDMYIRMMSAM